jgi:hypothetical protein
MGKRKNSSDDENDDYEQSEDDDTKITPGKASKPRSVDVSSSPCSPSIPQKKHGSKATDRPLAIKKPKIDSSDSPVRIL